MPLYDYKCPRDHEFELSMPMKDSNRKARCPECGQMAVKIIGGTPYVKFDWKMHSSADDGSYKLGLHPARKGVSSPLSQDATRITSRDVDRLKA